MNTLLLVIFVLVACTGSAFTGYELGKLREKIYWRKMRQMAIPGQRLWITGVGEVFLLGYSDDGIYVDFIPTSFLGERWPSELDVEILDKNTVSVKVDEFLGNMLLAGHKQAARLED